MKKEKSLASKRTMNLAIRESNAARNALMVPVIAAIVLVAALVGKFAVADRLAEVRAAQREVDAIKSQTEAMMDAYADFDEVAEQYNQYTYKDFDRSLAERMDVLALIEREIFPVCQVQRLALAEKRLDLALEGSTLGDGSALVARLEADPLVDAAFVSTATATAENGEVRRTTSMTILLADVSADKEVAS